MSPIATPPRAAPPAGLKTPNGKFCIGNSACPFAEATQLPRRGSWVSSIPLIAPPLFEARPPTPLRRDHPCFRRRRRDANDRHAGPPAPPHAIVPGLMLRFLLALWHVAGLLLLAVLVDRIRGRGLAPGRAAGCATAARPGPTAPPPPTPMPVLTWSAAYFDEFHRAVRVDWKPYVEWWQRPFRGDFVTIDERGLRPTPGEANPDEEYHPHPVLWRLDDDGHGGARRAHDPGGAGAAAEANSAIRSRSPISASSGTTAPRRR